MIKPTPEQFEEWRASPVTEWLMDTFLLGEMSRTRAAFEERAWEGLGDPIAHATHRERHDTLEWVRSLDMPMIDETLERQE